LWIIRYIKRFRVSDNIGEHFVFFMNKNVTKNKLYLFKTLINVVCNILLNDYNIPLTLIRQFATKYEYTTSFILFSRKINKLFMWQQSQLFAIIGLKKLFENGYRNNIILMYNVIDCCLLNHTLHFHDTTIKLLEERVVT